MIRVTASLLVVLMTAASGRLLACDYSCIEHTRAAHSSQPSCHEPEPEPSGPVFNAAQNDCVEQPALVPAYLAGKVSSLVKPAPTVPHVADVRVLSWAGFDRGAPTRVSPSHSPLLDRHTPLRI